MFVHARPLSCNDGFQEYYYSSDLYYSLKQLKVLSAKKRLPSAIRSLVLIKLCNKDLSTIKLCNKDLSTIKLCNKDLSTP